MTLKQGLQFKALRQREYRRRRQANYSLYHMSPQAAQQSTEAARDLKLFLDFILEVRRDSKLIFITKPQSSMSPKSANAGPSAQQHRTCFKGAPRTACDLMYPSMHETLQNKDCNLLDICTALRKMDAQPGLCL